MATNYNITMKQFNGTDYDNLYPAANLSNSIGSIQANQISGQIPASQISGLSTTPNVSNATGTLAVSHGGTGRNSLTSGYYLVGNGTGAVTLQSPSQLQSSLGLDDYAKIQTGSYTGTGTYGSSNPNSLTFNFSPKSIQFSGTNLSTIIFMFFTDNPNTRGDYVYISLNGEFYFYGYDTIWGNNTLQWYIVVKWVSSNYGESGYAQDVDAGDQLNRLNTIYSWLVIGQ